MLLEALLQTPGNIGWFSGINSRIKQYENYLHTRLFYKNNAYT